MPAAIFDMDGLLIDTEPLWRRTEVEVFGELGVPLTEEMCRQTTGMRLDMAVLHWYERFPWPGPGADEVAVELTGRVIAEIERSGEPMPGVRNTLRRCSDAGWPMAVASSSDHALIETVVQKLEIADHFERLFSAVDEIKGKPDPAVYLSAARGLGVDSAACVAFEDSVLGIRSAQAAGMVVVAVPDPERCDDPIFRSTEVRLESLIDFDDDAFDRVAAHLRRHEQ